MTQFANPAAFQFLWIIPVVIILYFILNRGQQKLILKSFGARIGKYLSASASTKKRKVKFILQIMALVFFIFALARPQAGVGEQKLKSEGIELVFMVDVSRSMLAEDESEGLSRLRLAKAEIQKFIDMSVGNRIGLIAFAGSAALLSPVTEDTSALKMFVDSLSTDVVSSQGTVFKSPLEMAEKAFERGGVESDEESYVTRAIVIASDGEDNEEGAMQVAEKLAKKGIRIFTLGFGSEKGAPIPQRDENGENRGYKKDRQGNVILTKTKGTVLKNLARTGRGNYYQVDIASNVMNKLLADVNELQKSTFNSSKFTSYIEYFQWPLLFGLLLSFIEILLTERKSAFKVWRGRFEN